MLLVVGIGIVSQDEEININLPASVAMVRITLALHATHGFGIDSQEGQEK